jgi:hypothetical protein
MLRNKECMYRKFRSGAHCPLLVVACRLDVTSIKSEHSKLILILCFVKGHPMGQSSGVFNLPLPRNRACLSRHQMRLRHGSGRALGHRCPGPLHE